MKELIFSTVISHTLVSKSGINLIVHSKPNERKNSILVRFNVARDTEHIIKFGNDDRQDSGV